MKNHCVDCGKEIYKSSVRCYSCATKHKWQDTAYKQHMSEASTELWENPKHRQRISECTTKQWEDPKGKIREQLVLLHARQWKDPEFVQKMSDKAKRQWEDADGLLRRNVTIANAKQWSDPEHIQLVSDSAKRQWNDPNCTLAANMRAGLRAKWQDPEYRQRMAQAASVRLAKLWLNPACRQKFMVHVYKMQKIFRPSALEMKFKSLLDAEDIEYVQQYKPDNFNRVYDFLLLDFDALVEIDGTFWHHSAWATKHGAPIKDDQKEQWAISHGFHFVRIPENDMPPDIVTAWLIPELEKIKPEE